MDPLFTISAMTEAERNTGKPFRFIPEEIRDEDITSRPTAHRRIELRHRVSTALHALANAIEPMQPGGPAAGHACC